ncbi:MAG: serine/threonine-protein kinase [Planctomycetota bacterium]
MSQPPVEMDGAKYLQFAVQHKMLTAACAKDLAKHIKRKGASPSQMLVDTGRLTPIQAEAIDGLVSPTSVASGYEVVDLLGYGGIGVVYRARQPNLDRLVALKTISTARVRQASGGKHASSLARFQQEAKAVARLKHPNIVAAYDYGAGDDRLYLAMEMVDGIDLESFIKQHQRIDEQTAWQLAKQAAAALAHAVDQKIIHRDIKPANLLLTDPPAGYPLPAGVPLLKITDFGLARFNIAPPGTGDEAEEATRLTMTGATMGTPHYMAPEQIDDATVDLHADIYALGATVYHMIAGAPPLAGKSLMKVFAAKLSGEGPAMDELPDDVSESSRELLVAMLQSDPADRPQTYDELLVRIDAVLGAEPAGPRPAPLLTTVGPEVSNRSESETLLAAPPVRRRAPLALLGICAALALGVTGFAWWSSNNSGPPAAAFVEATGGRAVMPLFNGLDHDYPEWQNVGTDPDYPGRLVVYTGAKRTIGEFRSTLEDGSHFAIDFSVVFADDAEALEVWIQPEEAAQPKSVRISRDTIAIGSPTMGASGFEPEQPPTPIIKKPGAASMVFRIARDEDYWLVYQSASAAGQSVPVAWSRHSGSPPDEIRFEPHGEGGIYIGDLSFVSLEPVGE